MSDGFVDALVVFLYEVDVAFGAAVGGLVRSAPVIDARIGIIPVLHLWRIIYLSTRHLHSWKEQGVIRNSLVEFAILSL